MSTKLGPFTIFIDGECPLCRREANLLHRLDRGRERLRLVDIAAPGFDPGAYGRSQDDFMGTIHGLEADGRLVTGMDVFRGAYRAVGLGWLLAPTAWPGLRGIADAGYRLFARYRLALTGRRDCASGACVRRAG